MYHRITRITRITQFIKEEASFDKFDEFDDNLLSVSIRVIRERFLSVAPLVAQAQPWLPGDISEEFS